MLRGRSQSAPTFLLLVLALAAPACNPSKPPTSPAAPVPSGPRVVNVKTYAPDLSVNVRALALHADGSATIAASYKYETNLGGETFRSRSGPEDWGLAFAHYGSGAEHLWSRDIELTPHASVRRMVAAPDGGVIVAGQFRGFKLGDRRLRSSRLDEEDVFFTRLAPDGQPVWVRQFGTPHQDSVDALTIGPDGHVALCGWFQGSISYGGKALRVSGRKGGASLASFTADGRPLWSRAFPTKNVSGMSFVVAGAGGELVVAGTFDEPIDLGGGLVESAGSFDAVLLGVGERGVVRWTRFLASERADSIQDLVALPAGGMLAVVGYGGDAPRAGKDQIALPGRGVHLVRLGADGEVLWTRPFDARGRDVEVSQVHPVPGGDLLLTGTFRGSFAYGGVEGNREQGVWIARLTPSGEPRWVMTGGKLESPVVSGVDAAGRLWLFAQFEEGGTLGGAVVRPKGGGLLSIVQLEL